LLIIQLKISIIKSFKNKYLSKAFTKMVTFAHSIF